MSLCGHNLSPINFIKKGATNMLGYPLNGRTGELVEANYSELYSSIIASVSVFALARE